MLSIPHISSGNQMYRLIVSQEALPGTDYERLEDLTANAIGAAREALNHLDALPFQLTQNRQTTLSLLRKHIAQRRVLTEDFRTAAQLLLSHLSRADVDDDTAPDHDARIRKLREALNTSHRVADLLAADRDIEWHRTRKH